MKTIPENTQNEIIIKNSRFLTYLLELSSSDISSFLENIKNKNPKANHYCYAYIYENEKGCSDDGEPSRTAGAPMLNVLEKEELNHVLAVTVRYFGGIKLGAGGLVRAYTKSVTEALKNVSLVELIEAYKVKVDFDYKDEKQVNYLVGEKSIIQKDYTSTPTYIVFIEKEKLSSLYPYSYEILEECYMKKDS